MLLGAGTELKKNLSRRRALSTKWGGPGSEFSIVIRKEGNGQSKEHTQIDGEKDVSDSVSLSPDVPPSHTENTTVKSTEKRTTITGVTPPQEPLTIHYFMRASSASLARGWVERLNRAVLLAAEAHSVTEVTKTAKTTEAGEAAGKAAGQDQTRNSTGEEGKGGRVDEKGRQRQMTALLTRVSERIEIDGWVRNKRNEEGLGGLTSPLYP